MAMAAAQREHTSPRPATRETQMDSLLKDLAKGTVLYKVLPPFRLRQRKFILDMKNMTLRYEGSEKRGRHARTEFEISSIIEVERDERNMSGKLRSLDPHLCFSVELRGPHDVLYLKASSQEERDNWLRGLHYAMQVEKQNHATDKWIGDMFKRADRNRSGNLDFHEILKLLKTLNVRIKEVTVKEMFNEADTTKSKKKEKPSLDREEFVKFYFHLTRRQELEELFMQYSGGKGYLTIQDLSLFLRDNQRPPKAIVGHCQEIIQQYEPQESYKKEEMLTFLGFRDYLMDEKNFLFKPSRKVIYQDMTRPITHYFIASSHNTYLAGNQLTGSSEVDAYITALQRGCRCVELDCWDGSDGEPIIYHGHTMTSQLLFKDVIKAVRQHAFEVSQYPLTLSVENHCSVPQQKQMARHLQDILGSYIYPASDDLDHIPSPEELKGKIIIKGKRLPPVKQQSEIRGDDDGEDVSAEDKGNEAVSSRQQQQQQQEEEDEEDEEDEEEGQQQQAKAKAASVELSPELSRLTAMKSVSFKDVNQARGVDNHFCVFSLGESKVKDLIKTNAADLSALSRSKLLRIYPGGSRVGSSNYNPTPMWNCGCQIVALNYQTSGEPMQLNHGRFLDNGGCGYVLKPDCLLSDEKFRKMDAAAKRDAKTLLKIKVISGFQIPKPGDSRKGEIIDPFVEIELYDVKSDENKATTKTVKNNGFKPQWNETFTFKVRVPELAVVRFVVKDDDYGRDDLIGYYCLPVSCMQQGYRHIPLFDKHGEKFSQSLLFLHVSIS